MTFFSSFSSVTLRIRYPPKICCLSTDFLAGPNRQFEVGHSIDWEGIKHRVNHNFLSNREQTWFPIWDPCRNNPKNIIGDLFFWFSNPHRKPQVFCTFIFFNATQNTTNIRLAHLGCVLAEENRWLVKIYSLSRSMTELIKNLLVIKAWWGEVSQNKNELSAKNKWEMGSPFLQILRFL